MSKPAQSTAEPRSEYPALPHALSCHSSPSHEDSTSHQRRPSSNFHVQTSSLRAASIQSKKSFTSTVTGLLRRATSRRIVSASADANGGDGMSVYSMASSPPERTTLPRRLSKQASDISLHSEISSSRLSQSYNRRTIIGNHTFSATDPGPARTRTRSGSRAPPSAFPGVPKASDPYTHISPVDIPDDDTVESVQDIKHQIELVEAEGRRLLDAFNGLELSTLTRRQRKPPVIPPIPSHGSLSDPTWLNGDRRSIRGGKDSDALSYKSNGSGRTTMSMKRSPSIEGKMRTVNSVGTLVSQHAVMRKGSFSSVSSRGRRAVRSGKTWALGSSSGCRGSPGLQLDIVPGVLAGANMYAFRRRNAAVLDARRSVDKYVIMLRGHDRLGLSIHAAALLPRVFALPGTSRTTVASDGKDLVHDQRRLILTHIVA
ncbi:hypothetical protein NUW54_g9702 [Trametes sanguinea]|uniref:Uncharacterized protein n=1 Tax=Trametes sanguinea TaxID=158606 RepID=A0ACC1P734_9APHY|nr:hypothetical protein NUW54_g9702 [Trametes sanguinea]